MKKHDKITRNIFEDGANRNNYRIDDVFGYSGIEKVYENFQLSTKTTIFNLTNGSLWPGAVHTYNNQYIAGSFHTLKPHAVLNATQIKNFKIKNLMTLPKKITKIKFSFNEFIILY